MTILRAKKRLHVARYDELYTILTILFGRPTRTLAVSLATWVRFLQGAENLCIPCNLSLSVH